MYNNFAADKTFFANFILCSSKSAYFWSSKIAFCEASFSTLIVRSFAKSPITKELKNGAAVVLHVHLDVWHYVLLTGIEDDKAYIFDPYYEDEESYPRDPHYIDDAIQFVFDQPKKYNRIVSVKRLSQTNLDYYAMGPTNNRIAVVMKRK